MSEYKVGDTPLSQMDIGIAGHGAVGLSIYRSMLKDGLSGVITYGRPQILDVVASGHDLLVYAAVSGKKYAANADPFYDMVQMKQALRRILLSEASHVILISTIDAAFEEGPYASAYGASRKWLEDELLKRMPEGSLTILRLPQLFGPHIKKNVIFDSNAMPYAHLDTRWWVPMDSGFKDSIIEFASEIGLKQEIEFDRFDDTARFAEGSPLNTGEIGPHNFNNPESLMVLCNPEQILTVLDKIDTSKNRVYDLVTENRVSNASDMVSKTMTVSDVYEMAGVEIPKRVLELQREKFPKYDQRSGLVNEVLTTGSGDLSWESIASQIKLKAMVNKK